jgi:hypothetical protein
MALIAASGKNLIRLNAKAMGFWREYEKQKNQHLVIMRDQLSVQA